MNPDDQHVWNRDRILERVRAVLAPAEYERLEMRLQGELEGAEAAWLEHVITAAETLPLPAPPADLSQSLREMFTARSTQRVAEAVLVRDSRIEQQLQGVRGADDDVGWTLSYSSEMGNILVDVWPNGEAFDVDVQLMSITAAAEFDLKLSGPVDVRAASDRLGRASVSAVPSGHYELRIERAAMEVFTQIELKPQR